MQKISQPAVCIILLNWNGWKDTLECTRSLERLNYDNYSIIIVDNGSTDDSISKIRQANIGAQLLLSPDNLGFSGGCNIGIQKALHDGADYIWLLNNDTVVEPDALLELVNVAQTNRDAGAIGSVIYNMDAHQEIQAWGGGHLNYWLGRAEKIYSRDSQSKLNYLTAASLLVRRSAFQDVGLLDEQCYFMYWEDVDFSLRLSNAGWKLLVADRSIIYHKEHASTGKGSILLAYYFNQSLVRFFLRHAPCPLLAILIGTIARLAKNLAKLNLGIFVAVIRGIVSGLSKKCKN